LKKVIPDFLLFFVLVLTIKPWIKSIPDEFLKIMNKNDKKSSSNFMMDLLTYFYL